MAQEDLSEIASESSATVEAVPDELQNPPIGYPREALRRRWQGRVLLDVLVLTSGECGAVGIKESSGHWILDRHAANVVRRWIFKPGRRLGKPIDQWIVLPVRFKLEKRKGQF